MSDRYHVMRDDRGRWGFSADGVSFDPGSGAYRTASEALDTLRALLRGRGMVLGPARADATGLLAEATREMPDEEARPDARD